MYRSLCKAGHRRACGGRFLGIHSRYSILSIAFFIVVMSAMFWGCGTVSSTQRGVTTPPLAADFSVTISTNALTVEQGGLSAPVSITVSPKNGFGASVQLTLTGLPAGVSSNPASPFNVTSGTDTSVVFGAAANAAIGTFPVSAQGVSGELSHMATVSLAVQGGVNAANFPRTNFVRTDSTTAGDNPPGEAHHRHIAYDAAHKHVFVANRTMNRLEVFSSVDQNRAAQITIPGATSADLSADAETVWVGTALNEIVAVDSSSLQVSRRYMQPGVGPLPSAVFDRPEEVLAVANGKCFVRLRQATSAQALLALWDPNSNSMSNLTSAAPTVFQNGAGPMARSGDQSRVIVAANDASGNVAVFGPAGAVIAGPRSIGAGAITWVAANSDGSRVAVAFTSGGVTQLVLLDAGLNQVATRLSPAIQGVVFSRDDSFVYLSELVAGAPVVTVLGGQDLHEIGQVPGAAIQGIAAQIESADETQLLFGISNRGVSFIDAAKPGPLSGPALVFAAAPAATPSEGPVSGGTALDLSGQNFPADVLLRIGTQLAGNVAVTGPNLIQATSPSSSLNSAVNIRAYSPSNHWLGIAPEAFSYGPQILRVLPNTGVNSGGDTVQIFGYGFGNDSGAVTVKIGGANAIVQSVDNISAIAPAMGLDSTYPFPLERITLQTPASAPGAAGVSISSASGSANFAGAFQYFESVQSYAKPGFFRFLAYDKKRQRIYLTNIDHVDVFDLNIGAFIAPIQPAGGPPPNAGWRGLSLTPDASQLAIADFGAQSVYLFDPDTGSGAATFVGGVAGFANSGPARVAATSTQSIFVGLSVEGGSASGCASCLSQMNVSVSPPMVQTAPEPAISGLLGAPLLQGNAAGDHVVLAFGNNSAARLAVWDAAAPDQFNISSADATVSDIAASDDGAMFSLQTSGGIEVRDASMFITSTPISAELTKIAGRSAVPGLAMHPSGALLYQPFLAGTAGAAGVRGGVDISDVRSGELRLRIYLPQQFMTDVDALHGEFLAIDENGQRLFAITSLDGTPQNASLTVIKLAAVPLAIGTVSPSGVCGFRRHNDYDSWQWLSSWNYGHRGWQIRCGTGAGHEHADHYFAAACGRRAAAYTYQCKRRERIAGRRDNRQLSSNFS